MSNPYSVKNVKSFMGREGYGFECSLYRDGKKIGTVTDTANGGMTDFYLDSKEEEDRLDAYCATLPARVSEIPAEPPMRNQPYTGKMETITIEMSRDIFIAGLVDEYETNKKLKRYCKTQTLYRLHSDKDDSHWVIGIKYTEKVKQQLQDKHGSDLKEIINERFI